MKNYKFCRYSVFNQIQLTVAFCTPVFELLAQIYTNTHGLVKAVTSIKQKISTWKYYIIQVVFFAFMALPVHSYSGIEVRKNFNTMITYKTTLPLLSLKYQKTLIDNAKICSSSDAADLLRRLFDQDLLDYREEFLMLMLNRSNNTFGFCQISTGVMAGSVVDFRMIFLYAVQSGATSIILAHNHPSGSLNPSQQDLDITRRIAAAGTIMDIKLLDHLIITSESFYSFADEGKLTT